MEGECTVQRRTMNDIIQEMVKHSSRGNTQHNDVSLICTCASTVHLQLYLTCHV